MNCIIFFKLLDILRTSFKFIWNLLSNYGVELDRSHKTYTGKVALIIYVQMILKNNID